MNNWYCSICGGIKKQMRNLGGSISQEEESYKAKEFDKVLVSLCDC
jgi:hypothetical protein